MYTICRASFVRWFLLPFTLVLWLGITSCTHWSEPRSPVESVIADKEPNKIRVTTVDGWVTELQSPRIESDTLIGFGWPAEKEGVAQQLKVPLADVKRVEVRSTNVVPTVLLAAGVSLLLVAVIDAASEPVSPPRSTYTSSGEPMSCPFVYSWDGEAWRLDSGTFGGAFLEPLARTDVDNLMFARAEDGVLRLRLANEMAETDYVDALRVRAVDHPIGTEVVPDASASGALYLVGTLAAPLAARDDRGRDALSAVSTVDGWGWESSPSGRDTAVAADVRDGLELEFSRPAGARQATLVLDGNNTPWSAVLMQQFVAAHGRETDAWYASMNANPLAAWTLGQRLAREGFLQVSVRTDAGWAPQGLVWEAGPEVAKRQAMRLDLSDVEGETVTVRLESIPMFWNLDRVAIDFTAVDEAWSAPVDRELTAASARMESDGRDVASLLAAVDGTKLVLETGEAAELAFVVPPVPEGSARSYLLSSTGWYRIHTAPSDAAPNEAVVRFEREGAPGDLSRIAVSRLNEALALLADRASQASGASAAESAR
jgi:hypothetical protein